MQANKTGLPGLLIIFLIRKLGIKGSERGREVESHVDTCVRYRNLSRMLTGKLYGFGVITCHTCL
jgi:hypothetical protein